MARNIIKRYRTWYAVLDVPQAVRHHFDGKTKFTRTLDTHSEAQALRRAPVIVAEWRLEIERAKRNTSAAMVDPLEADVQWIKARMAEATDARESGEGWVLDDPDDDVRGSYPGADAVDDLWRDFLRDMDRKNPKRAQAVYRRATGETTGTAAHLDDWLARSTDTVKNKRQKRTEITRLAEKFPTLNLITRKSIRQWRDRLPVDHGWRPATVTHTMSTCRNYWRFLQQIEAVSEDGVNPFEGLPPIMKTKADRNATDEAAPFEAGDVVRVLDAARKTGHRGMVDLITLAMWTGARQGELCALKVQDVDLDGKFFKVSDAKTKSGIRTIPIHKKLQGTMARLCAASVDGYVMTGLVEDKNGSRTAALATRFSRLKRSMGFGRQHNFHSFRRTVVTLLEQAHVDEGITADMVGHKKSTITYGLYSGGHTLATKAEALALLTYPM